MKRPAIPSLQEANPRWVRAITENVEIITGRRGLRLDPLPETATLPEVIRWLNTLRNRLEG